MATTNTPPAATQPVRWGGTYAGTASANNTTPLSGRSDIGYVPGQTVPVGWLNTILWSVWLFLSGIWKWFDGTGAKRIMAVGSASNTPAANLLLLEALAQDTTPPVGSPLTSYGSAVQSGTVPNNTLVNDGSNDGSGNAYIYQSSGGTAPASSTAATPPGGWPLSPPPTVGTTTVADGGITWTCVAHRAPWGVNNGDRCHVVGLGDYIFLDQSHASAISQSATALLLYPYSSSVSPTVNAIFAGASSQMWVSVDWMARGFAGGMPQLDNTNATNGLPGTIWLANLPLAAAPWCTTTPYSVGERVIAVNSSGQSLGLIFEAVPSSAGPFGTEPITASISGSTAPSWSTAWSASSPSPADGGVRWACLGPAPWTPATSYASGALATGCNGFSGLVKVCTATSSGISGTSVPNFSSLPTSADGTISSWASNSSSPFGSQITFTTNSTPLDVGIAMTKGGVVQTGNLPILSPSNLPQSGGITAPTTTSLTRTQVTLSSSPVHFSTGWSCPSGSVYYWKDPLGYVHWEGIVSYAGGGSTTILAGIPSGFLSTQSQLHWSSVNEGTGTVGIMVVLSSGSLAVTNLAGLSSGDSYSLAGIIYLATA